jgi:hypothetical protein
MRTSLPTSRPAAWVLAISLAGALTACGDDGAGGDPPDAGDPPSDAAPMPRQIVTRTIALTAPALREAELTLGAGDRVHVLASTAEPRLQWNVHTHAGGGTTVLGMGLNVATVDHWVEATAASDYFLLLLPTSGSLSVQVTLELYGQAQYAGGLD